MSDLIAQGPESAQRWRRTLEADCTYVIGRTAAWGTPWDAQISGDHARITWRDGFLQVEKLPEARNAVFHRGEPKTRFFIEPRDHFVIGATTFTLTDEEVEVTLESPQPLSERSYSAQALKRVQFRNAEHQITVLSRLPDIISRANSDTELFVQLVNVLLIGVPRATAAAVIEMRGTSGSASTISVLHWDRRVLIEVKFQPSERLIRQALEKGESVVHVWGGSPEHKFTAMDNVDWAFATPVPGDACRGWVIYLAGSFAGSAATVSNQPSDPHDFSDDLKFAELAATTLGSLRDVRMLEHNRTSLSQFFSPRVMEAVAGQNPDQALAPRETEVSVLFCDLRGFSRKSEQMANDLFGLLERVSQALGVTTHSILEQGGVVGDFHGDAAMGFWGWPLQQPDAPLRACKAALGIRAELQRASQLDDHALADFRMGVGIATGRAVAGKIGTVDQVKVTVFGPVVNLAARLEGMTDIIRAPILLDEPTARYLRENAQREVARLRRVAVVQPYGMNTPVEVSELLPPEADFPQMSDEHIAAYESALDALLNRDWDQAFRLLHNVPADDRVKDFLTVFIAQHNRTPPDDWQGVIELKQK